MAFHHRKLLNESFVDPSATKLCENFCIATENLNGVCPFTCIKLCYPVCKPLLQIPPPPPAPTIEVYIDPPGKPHRISLFLTISLAILATTFFLFTCYTIYKLYSNWNNSRRRRSQSRQPEEETGPDDFLDEDQGPVVDHPIWYIRTVGLQPSVISAITVVKYKRGDGLIEGTDCSVCLSEFQEDETLRLLPKCNHAFHIPCIDTWLRSHTNCPMCRAGIVNNTAVLPSQELIVQNSGLVEETRLALPGSNREVRRETENEASEMRIGIEDDSESRAQIRLKINENLREEEGNSFRGGIDGIQPMRRSVSVDSLSASMISAAIANAFPGQSDGNSDNQLVEMKESTLRIISNRVGTNQSLLRLGGSPSIERSGPSSMNRSLSCSAKVLLSRYNSRSRNSAIPK